VGPPGLEPGDVGWCVLLGYMSFPDRDHCKRVMAVVRKKVISYFHFTKGSISLSVGDSWRVRLMAVTPYRDAGDDCLASPPADICTADTFG